MGRWMEIVRERPPDDVDYRVWQPQIVAENGSHPLVWATMYMPHKVRAEFPLLKKIDIHSHAYVDESLWLSSDESAALLDELQRLRRICRNEEFLWELSESDFYEQWQHDYAAEEFEAWLDNLEGMLEQAALENLWVHLML